MLNRIRQFLHHKWSQGLQLLRTLLLASMLLVPSIASAASSSPSSTYYLQNNPYQTTQQQQQSEISIQTKPSSHSYSSNHNSSGRSNNNTVRLRRQYPQTTRFIKSKSNRTTSQRKVQQFTTLILLLTLTASSLRASRRPTKIVRQSSPFGQIRNSSLLGNGVSVIRVCMLLHLTGEEEGRSLLNKLYLEEKELYRSISMLSQDSVELNRLQQQQQWLSGANEYRQKALGKYLSKVAATFLQYTSKMRYGTVDSVRVPFVEDAMREFRHVVGEDRGLFASIIASAQQKKKKKALEFTENNDEVEDTEADPQKSSKHSGYVLATILLSIKGDRTSTPLPLFGVLRQRDVAKALSRIAKDATVENCLVGSEVQWLPNISNLISSDDDGQLEDVLLSKEDVLKAFPELIPLT